MSNKILIDFDWKTYLELNEDLKHLTEVEAKKHYLEYGINENRIVSFINIPTDFNWKTYIELNYDLSHMTELELKIHYLQHGIKENRKYKYVSLPNDFGTKTYIELNKEITITNENNINLIEINYIIFVFPQFHSIPENDKHWFKNFTEWDNLKDAKSVILFQDIIFPTNEIGYYNLLDFSNRKRYLTMCKEYGISTLLYYHYWFEGKPVMYKPLLNQMDDDTNPELPDINWFVNYVNEPWSKRWDGGNQEVFLNITYDNPDDHYLFLSKLFKSKNYVIKENKPWIAFYILDEIPTQYLNKLISLSILDGYDGLTVININGHTNYLNINKSDLSIDFHPNYVSKFFPPDINFNKNQISLDDNNYMYKNNIFKIDKYLKQNNYILNHLKNNMEFNVIEHFDNLNYNDKNNRCLPVCLKNIRQTYENISKINQSYDIIPGVFNKWDNTPRHKALNSQPTVYIDGNINDFEQLLNIQISKLKHTKYKCISINSLNEWGEGCVFDETNLYGDSYLKIIKKYKKINFNELIINDSFKKKNKKRLVIVSHDNSLYGASNVVLNFLKYIDSLNIYEIYYIVKNTTCKIDDYKLNNTTFIYLNFETLSLHHYYYYIDKSIKILRAIEPDIVFCNTIITSEFYKASIELNLYTILYIHENIGEFFRVVNNNHEWGMLPSGDILKKINTIFCVNEDIKNYLINILNIDVNKIYIKPPFINTTNIDKLINNSFNYNKITIGMCGSGTHRKGFDIFCNIAKKNPKFDFIWIGPNQEFLNIKEFPNNLTITGYTNNPYYFLKNLDFFLLTSREDPHPLVVLESLYLNIKVISFNNTNIGCLDIIKKYGFIIKDDNDINDINDIFINNNNSKQYILDNYSITKNSEDIINYFKNINFNNNLGDYVIPCERFKFVDLVNIDKNIWINNINKTFLDFSEKKYFHIFVKNFYLNDKNLNEYKIRSDSINSMLTFNKIFYKLNYNDIKNYTGCCYEHYINNGIKENRLSCINFKNIKKIAITIQFHNITQINEIEKYITNIMYVCDKLNYYYCTYICYTDTIENKCINYFLKYKNIILIPVKNYGADIYKFTKTIKYIIQSGEYYDFYLKFHTKTNDKWRNEMLKIFEKKNLEEVFNIFSNNNIGCICNKKQLRLLSENGMFEDNKIEHDYSKIINEILKYKDTNYKNIYNLPNTDTIQNILQKNKNADFDENYYLDNNDDLYVLPKDELYIHFINNGYKELRFCNENILNTLKYPKYCSGTCFIIRGPIVNSFLNNHIVDYINQSIEIANEKEYFTDEKIPTITHGIERYFGLICSASGYEFYGF
jgi:hypothetical protein